MLFAKLFCGIEILKAYHCVNAGYDYDDVDSNMVGRGMYVWIMVKHPIEKTYFTYQDLTKLGWQPNEQGTTWKLYQ